MFNIPMTQLQRLLVNIGVFLVFVVLVVFDVLEPEVLLGLLGGAIVPSALIRTSGSDESQA